MVTNFRLTVFLGDLQTRDTTLPTLPQKALPSGIGL
jgi:hypothetical protein